MSFKFFVYIIFSCALMLTFFSIYLSKTVIKDFPNQTLDFKNCNSVWDFLHWIEWDIDIIHMMRHGIWDIDIVNMIYVMVYDIYTLRYKHEFFSVWMLTRNILTDRSDTNLPVRTVSKWLGNDKMTSEGYILEEELRENCCYFIFSRSYALHCRAKKSQC